MLKLCKCIFIIFHFRCGGVGTGSVYTHAHIQIDGSIHKKTDRKLILAKILFPFHLLSFQPLKVNLDHRELSPSPAQPFSTCWSASIRMVLLTLVWFSTLHNWTFNSGLFYTLLPQIWVVHHCMGDSSPGQGTEFFFFPQGRWVFNCTCALEELCQGNLYRVLLIWRVTSFEVSIACCKPLA